MADESKSLLENANAKIGQYANNPNHPGWWPSDSGSSSGSCYSSSDCSEVEWEPFVEPAGELFYIESPLETFVESKSVENDDSEFPPELTRRRSMRAGKIIRLIKRKSSTRGSMRNKKPNSSEQHRNNHETIQEEYALANYEAGRTYSFTAWVDPNIRHKFGRRATMCEAYLGIIPGLMPSDNSKIIVTGFTSHDRPAETSEIKVGDWIRSINSRDVTSKNIDSILATIISPMNVTVNLQQMVSREVVEDNSIIRSLQQSSLVKRIIDKTQSKNSMESLVDLNFGMVYAKTSNFTDSSDSSQGILYTYPRSKRKNVSPILMSIKGAFVTLSHMLPENIGFQPISSTISISNQIVHIIYLFFQEELLLVALPNDWCSESESIQFTADIVRSLSFTNESISQCFSDQNNHPYLDHIFHLFFSNILHKSNPVGTEIAANKSLQICEFETILPASQFIHLPRDAQIQIDAALNEMEAMDYREWNEDPMDCQRLYTILGSCLYHKNYLLGSHLPHEMCVQVNSYLRQHGILNLISKEPVKSLVVWKKVYPSSFIKNESDHSEGQLFLEERCFLLVVGFGHDILAVILESGGCTAKYEPNSGPDVFYVEEAQETLLHIQKIGVPTLAEKWVTANAKPEIAPFEANAAAKVPASLTENLLNFIKSTDSQNTLSKSSIHLSGRRISQETISYTKQRSFEDSIMKSGSVYSLQTSEDSLSQGTGAISEMSDEAAPILGRRATREKSARHSEDSDSDLDVYKNDSHSSTMDISDIREKLLNQAQYITPKRLTTARDNNYLFHYVHLDLYEGVVLSSHLDRNSARDAKFVSNFNKCAHVIHKLLQNTMRFKSMLNQDIDKPVINKSLVAIKEHGVLFEWDNLSFWVVGRLYLSPQPKELYVCYDDSAPQNVVEIAFRLNSMRTQ